MPMPIVTIRNATGPGDDAAQGVRRSLPSMGPRAEAVQKILDALARHLSGEQVLSSDAVARLIDDLSRLLKSTLLPQDRGLAATRQLLAFIESLPAPERLAVERELSRNPLQRLAAAVREAASVPPAEFGAVPPLPAERPAIRSLPLSASAPLQNPAAPASTSADAALLQAMLKRTFGPDGEAGGTDPAIEDRPEGKPDAARVGPKPENAGESRRAPVETHGPAPLEDGSTETVHRILPRDADSSAPRATAERAGQTPAAPGGDAPVSDARGKAGAKTEQARHSGAEREPEEGSEGPDSDGTYGPQRARGEGDRQQARPAAARNETAAPSRALGDAVKALVTESPGDLHKPAVGERSEAPGSPSDRRQPSRDLPAPAPARDTAIRSRNTMAGGEPSVDPAAADRPDPPARDSAAIQQHPRQAPEDRSTQQAIAFLVDSGLPKEVIPFALVPFPPAQAEAENDEPERELQDESDEDGEAGAEDGGEGDARRHGEDGPSEEPDAADPYDLYRKLGGLG
ncbi:hypothetical protein [Ensifer sp. LCM 4579]|uniref:hypothetical protein n=1 Tax=Ensifer sp. LCM 4579 TaxID=1848292 RepID=UPI0008D9DE65|nr:hypothetical protein [Ensifer sp. LCM 4579]OHV73075.1 hypothetical protein LCM4579_08915 [Ensifer sp. LCM 4579]